MMAIDKKVYEAVYAAVQNYNQPDKVAKTLMNWLEDVSDVPERLSNQDETKVYIEMILDALQSDEYADEMDGLE